MAAPAVTEEVEIPNSALVKAGAILGTITALITAVIPLITLFANTRPDAKQAREQADNMFFSSQLARALQVETAEGRRTSVRLLLATGLLKARDDQRMNELLTGTDSLPRWAAPTPDQAQATAPVTPRPAGGASAPNPARDTTATSIRR